MSLFIAFTALLNGGRKVRTIVPIDTVIAVTERPDPTELGATLVQQTADGAKGFHTLESIQTLESKLCDPTSTPA